jgi:hypothetical protein
VMRNKWISLRRLKIHEFHRTLRHIRRIETSWHDIYIGLGKMQLEATNRFIKSLSSLLAIYLLLQSLGKGSVVSLTLLQITASVPIAYVTMVGAIMLFVVLWYLQSVMMIIAIRSAESVRIKLPGFSANMYGMLNGQDEMALVVPVILNRHLKGVVPISSFLTYNFTILFLSMLLPIVAYAGYLLSWQINLIRLNDIIWIEKIAAVIGMFVVAQSFFFALLFNIPLPLRKNTFSIRWGVLYQSHPFGAHPKIHKWLGESEK